MCSVKKLGFNVCALQASPKKQEMGSDCCMSYIVSLCLTRCLIHLIGVVLLKQISGGGLEQETARRAGSLKLEGSDVGMPRGGEIFGGS